MMASKEVKFLGEGNAERLMLRWLKIPDDMFREVSGNGNIAAFMQKHEKNAFYQVIVGITDNDKIRPDYFDNFYEQRREANLILQKHNDFSFYLITVCPAFEKWLLAAAQVANIISSDYKIPNTAKDLKRITRKDTLEKDQIYQRFFSAVKKANPPDFQIMSDWLGNLKKMAYEHKHSK